MAAALVVVRLAQLLPSEDSWGRSEGPEVLVFVDDACVGQHAPPKRARASMERPKRSSTAHV